MSWTAIVPVNFGRERKTRLAGFLPSEVRTQLVEQMAQHVFAILRSVDRIGRLVLLSPVAEPAFEGTEWITDHGLGLNAELTDAVNFVGGKRVLIIHADLPAISANDVIALIEASERSGLAMVPDWRVEGTNALAAISGQSLFLHFGPDSFAKHKAAMPQAEIMYNEHIGLDLDTNSDLFELRRRNLTANIDALLSPARYGNEAI
jgi:2-phospho-L-lactate/phosphoenolpyruvate guanylyltransferase